MATETLLPYEWWLSGTNENSVPSNNNSLRNAIINGDIISDSVTAQPGSPANFDAYILAATHTGSQWGSFAQNDLVIYYSGLWYAFTPVEGPVFNVNGTLRRWNGTAYVDAASGGGGGGGNVVTAVTSSAGVLNLDLSLGNYFTITLTENITSITFSNLPGSGKGASIMIRITQDSTPRTVAWPASFKWEGGAAGSVSSGSGVIDLLAISTLSNGTAWDATLSKGRA